MENNTIDLERFLQITRNTSGSYTLELKLPGTWGNLTLASGYQWIDEINDIKKDFLRDCSTPNSPKFRDFFDSLPALDAKFFTGGSALKKIEELVEPKLDKLEIVKAIAQVIDFGRRRDWPRCAFWCGRAIGFGYHGVAFKKLESAVVSANYFVHDNIDALLEEVLTEISEYR